MKNQVKAGAWQMSEHVYNQIQELKRFVDFVANLEIATENDRSKGEEIKLLMGTIHLPRTRKHWQINLRIHDFDVHRQVHPEGQFRRIWSLVCNDLGVSLEAESNYCDYPEGHTGSDFCFYDSATFYTPHPEDPINFQDGDAIDFVNDAMDYKKYITESLNEVEITVETY
ncbi:MAG: hypothetical protein KDC83_11815 [Flavobacteriales bacterium]|nr:hypothetical protein [Flavobacteriales bacterium]